MEKKKQAIDEINKMMRCLEKAIEAHRSKDVEKCMHELKFNSQFLGWDKASAVCEEMEDLARRGYGVAGRWDGLVSALEQGMQQAKDR